jgi:hypothetical protein
MKKTIAFNISIYSLVILPSFLFKVLNSSSMSDGLFIGIVVFMLTITVVSRNTFRAEKKHLYIIFLILLFVTIHYFTSQLLFKESDKTRFLLSYLLLATISTTSILFFNISIFSSNSVLNTSLKSIYYLLLLDGLISSYYHTMGLSAKKEMILFTEPSHFALVFLPFLAYVSYQSKKSQLLHLIIATIISLIIENTTLLIGLLLITYTLNIKNPYFLIGLIPISLIVIFNEPKEITSINYFLERIQLDSENISSLSFMAGWESAYQGFINSYGVGIGFQQLGIVELESSSREKLAMFYLDQLNIYDGSSLAPKIIAEFGIFGIFGILLYMIFLIKISRKIIHRKIKQPVNIFFAFSFVTFVIILFVRGTGYFSPSVFMFIASIHWLYKNKHNQNL